MCVTQIDQRIDRHADREQGRDGKGRGKGGREKSTKNTKGSLRQPCPSSAGMAGASDQKRKAGPSTPDGREGNASGTPAAKFVATHGDNEALLHICGATKPPSAIVHAAICLLGILLSAYSQKMEPFAIL